MASCAVYAANKREIPGTASQKFNNRYVKQAEFDMFRKMEGLNMAEKIEEKI